MKLEFYDRTEKFGPDFQGGIRIRTCGTIRLERGEMPDHGDIRDCIPNYAVPKGFRRQQSTYVLDVYGTTLRFSMLDVEERPTLPDSDAPIIVES